MKGLLFLVRMWAEKHEEVILEKGIPLDEAQQMDANRMGIRDISKIRLLKVENIPAIPFPQLKKTIAIPGILTSIAGITFRYGIYIRADCWNRRSLVVHELAHTLQYERMGGFNPFLKQYLKEYFAVGYPNGALEKEAKRIEKEIC